MPSHGWAELENEILKSKSGTSHSRISVDLLLFPHNQTSILSETVAAKWEPLAGDELDRVGSAADRVSSCESTLAFEYTKYMNGLLMDHRPRLKMSYLKPEGEQ
jgi:hypothetical protein